MAYRSTGQAPDIHARTDQRSVGTSAESLYLWQIAVQQSRIRRLRDRVDQQEQELQHVIDRYEYVLQNRTDDGKPPSDATVTD
jgi:hypothetical protein